MTITVIFHLFAAFGLCKCCLAQPCCVGTSRLQMENNNGADLEVTKKERGRKGICAMFNGLGP